jgi:hypothetical protein
MVKTLLLFLEKQAMIRNIKTNNPGGIMKKVISFFIKNIDYPAFV